MTIVYSSETGFTAEYARLLAEKSGLKALSLEEAMGQLAQGEEILYMGWLMAGSIYGYKKAMKRWIIKGVCAVGMGPCGSRKEETAKANRLPADLPLFTLQGGYAPDRLKGIHKLMMAMVARVLIKKIKAEAPNEENQEILRLLQNGGSAVCAENLGAVRDWLSL